MAFRPGYDRPAPYANEAPADLATPVYVNNQIAPETEMHNNTERHQP
jgi:hypothetical protein